MPSRRIQRLNEQLRREISEVVRWNVKDPRVGPAAISRVETSADLAHARVWVVIVGDNADEKETLAGLAGAAAFIRSQLSDRIEVRKVPALQFRVDRSMAHATHIQKLLGGVQPSPSDYDPDWEKEFERVDDELDGGVEDDLDVADADIDAADPDEGDRA
jgi:ribosome-binding factor A